MAKTRLLASTAAAALMVGVTSAQAGNYSTGVQIGSAPTAAQLAHHEDQMRIRYNSDFLHESEHRHGGRFLMKIGKHLLKSARNTLRGRDEEWRPMHEEISASFKQ